MAFDDSSSSSTLSKRSKALPVDLEYINTYSVYPALQNPYHCESNPEGIINFGTAVSGLMDDVWMEHFSSHNNFFSPNPSHFRYYQFFGPNEFRQKLAAFLTTFFKPRIPVTHTDVFVLNGALLSLDILSYLLADEGDVFLCPVPGYNGYFQAGVQRWGIHMASVPLLTLDHQVEGNTTGEEFQLSVHSLEKVFSEELAKGRNVRALVFNNPQNPIGKVFSPEMVREIMKFCQRHGIHLIADEMYCMSVFDKDTDFRSVLEVHEPELLDSNRLHLIWGFSKDLCLTSFRTGVIHTKNETLRNALMSGAQFQAVPLPVMNILSNLISDIDWFKHEFMPKNHERLRKAYGVAKAFFDSVGIDTTTTKAGFFFLADFRPLLNPPNEATAKEFIRKLYANKVYLTPSWEMRAELGWFRFVFTPYSCNGLEVGLQRLKKVINEWKAEGNKLS